jgi:glycosyltransferase involved in cell wall biosynthesis
VISVITPTFNTTPSDLLRTWESLKNQSFTDWEWVVWDDSTENATWSLLQGIAADERFKVSVHRSLRHSGSIGDVKRNGFMVSHGEIYVELDHDDELTPDCLQEIHDAMQDPSIGFVYSDWCEILPDGLSGKYPDGWAFGFGSHYWNDDYKYWVMRTPEINRTTISHIVSVPNHVRAWRASVYHQLSGHDVSLPIADDYELIVRTVLATETFHIPKLLYIQHIGAHTAQRQRNDLIQRLVAEISTTYSDLLDKRFAIQPD